MYPMIFENHLITATPLFPENGRRLLVVDHQFT
jgi:hypothetical protein